MSELVEHPNAHVLRWIASGHDVECRLFGARTWCNLTQEHSLQMLSSRSIQFRIKPKPVQPQPRLVKRFGLIGLDKLVSQDPEWPYALIPYKSGARLISTPYLEVTVENGQLVKAEVVA